MTKTNGGTKAPPKHLTEKEAIRRYREAQRKEQAAKTRKARNAWRMVVTKRRHQLREARHREALKHRPHVVTHHGRHDGFRHMVEGGTPDQRQLFAWRYAHHVARLHYSEPGLYLPGYFLHNVPSDEDRSDCSWGFLECRRVCGLRDFVHGDEVRFTGSIISHGREVSRAHAANTTGCAVVFGSGTGFHVGMSIGGGTTEIWQHGTPTFRKGTFDEFGSGTEVRYFTYAK